jgi:hypothetical protein
MRILNAVAGLIFLPTSILQILLPNTGPADPNQWAQPRLQTELNQIPDQVSSANQSGPSPFTPIQPENKSQIIAACLPNVPLALQNQREPEIKNPEGVNPAMNFTSQQFCDAGITPQPLMPTAPSKDLANDLANNSASDLTTPPAHSAAQVGKAASNHPAE